MQSRCAERYSQVQKRAHSLRHSPLLNRRFIKTGSGQTEEKIVKDCFLAGCPRLAHLDLSGCRHVDNGVLATIGTLPGLRKLAICGCREFDDAGVKQVRNGLKKRS
jgi:hypothetical protein